MSEEKRLSEEGNTEESKGNGKLKVDKEKVARFLRYPEDKRKYQNFLTETFTDYEAEDIQCLIERIKTEHKSELRGAKPHYKPGHIGALAYEYLNMTGVEDAFASGIEETKSSMVKSVQQKSDDVNTLMRGLGGFNRQIKASFSRSAVIYLEKDNPKNNHTGIVIFSINLPTFELKRELTATKEVEEVLKDDRDKDRLIWDYTVNTLSEIVSNTGLKPKYVKNNKNRFHLEMQRKLLAKNEPWPDEFFIFTLDNLDEEALVSKIEEYEASLKGFDEKIEALKKSLNGWGRNRKKVRIQNEIYQLEEEKTFYVSSTPDPREIDPGLLLEIKISTSKDYTLTKDKVQSIMTKFILALSDIAVDRSMDSQLMTDYSQVGRSSQLIEIIEAPSQEVEQEVTQRGQATEEKAPGA